MSTDRSALTSSLKESDQEILMQLIRRELVSIPIEHWGFFFPCHIAVWRFIETKYPGVIGPLKATYSDEPYFEGRGASWFCEVLADNSEYLDLLEAIMYPITSNAPQAVRERVRHRGFFFDNEIGQIDAKIVQELAKIILEKVDEGMGKRLIK